MTTIESGSSPISWIPVATQNVKPSVELIVAHNGDVKANELVARLKHEQRVAPLRQERDAHIQEQQQDAVVLSQAAAIFNDNDIEAPDEFDSPDTIQTKNNLEEQPPTPTTEPNGRETIRPNTTASAALIGLWDKKGKNLRFYTVPNYFSPSMLDIATSKLTNQTTARKPSEQDILAEAQRLAANNGTGNIYLPLPTGTIVDLRGSAPSFEFRPDALEMFEGNIESDSANAYAMEDPIPQNDEYDSLVQRANETGTRLWIQRDISTGGVQEYSFGNDIPELQGRNGNIVTDFANEDGVVAEFNAPENSEELLLGANQESYYPTDVMPDAITVQVGSTVYHYDPRGYEEAMAQRTADPTGKDQPKTEQERLIAEALDTGKTLWFSIDDSTGIFDYKFDGPEVTIGHILIQHFNANAELTSQESM